MKDPKSRKSDVPAYTFIKMHQTLTLGPNALIDGLSTQLKYLDLLHPHKHVDFVVLKPDMLAADAIVDLVLAIVAGYDTAAFGMPDAQKTFPLLVCGTCF